MVWLRLRTAAAALDGCAFATADDAAEDGADGCSATDLRGVLAPRPLPWTL